MQLARRGGKRLEINRAGRPGAAFRAKLKPKAGGNRRVSCQKVYRSVAPKCCINFVLESPITRACTSVSVTSTPMGKGIPVEFRPNRPFFFTSLFDRSTDSTLFSLPLAASCGPDRSPPKFPSPASHLARSTRTMRQNLLRKLTVGANINSHNVNYALATDNDRAVRCISVSPAVLRVHKFNHFMCSRIQGNPL